jgi:hypothetical protein
MPATSHHDREGPQRQRIGIVEGGLVADIFQAGVVALFHLRPPVMPGRNPAVRSAKKETERSPPGLVAYQSMRHRCRRIRLAGLPPLPAARPAPRRRRPRYRGAASRLAAPGWRCSAAPARSGGRAPAPWGIRPVPLRTASFRTTVMAASSPSSARPGARRQSCRLAASLRATTATLMAAGMAGSCGHGEPRDAFYTKPRATVAQAACRGGSQFAMPAASGPAARGPAAPYVEAKESEA